MFGGTVGAGKSTEMKLLASKLRKKDIRVKTAHLKTNHLLAHLLMQIVVRVFIRDESDTYPIRFIIEERPAVFRKMFRLWLTLDVLSISLKFFLTIYLPAKTGFTMLVEEYIPSTISDYIFLAKSVGLPLKSLSFALNHMLRLMSLINPLQVIFLDASSNELSLRWSRRGGQDERPDYLHMQRTMLLYLSKRLSSREMLHIDTTSQSTEKTLELIVNHLEL